MTRLRIVPERSRVVIDATSSVHPIHSETSAVEGWWETDSPGGHLELAVGALTSGNPLIDAEMKRRINAHPHPTITGELTSFEPTRGEVTFRGVTRSVEGELTVTPQDDGSVRITGERVFDVREFDFQPPRILMLRVHPEVSVRIDLVVAADE